jgi:hypothetical protein
MNAQLSEIVLGFQGASERLDRLVRELPAELWTLRTDPQRWSVAECVEHLNLTGRVYLPILEDAIDRARPRYRRDPVGWLLWKSMPPPVRHRVRTTAPFVPGSGQPPAELVAEFDRLQQEQIALVRDADGLPLHRIRVVSPFNARVRYNAFSCLSILPPHQHRHLWQAEQVHDAARA